MQLVSDLDAVFLNYPDLAEDEELRRHVLANGTDFLPAIETCLSIMREAETMAEAIELRQDEMNERAKRMYRKRDAMRKLMQRLMEHAHEKKLTFPEATLRIKQISRSVVIEDEKLLPDDFIRIKREPNKKKIKEWLETGDDVPGACLSNGGTTLAIRTK